MAGSEQMSNPGRWGAANAAADGSGYGPGAGRGGHLPLGMLSKRDRAHASERGEKPVPLVLYYTIASIIVIAVAAVVVNYAFNRIEFGKLVDVTKRRTGQEAHHLNTILSYQPALSESDGQGLTLQRLSDVRVMDSIVANPAITTNLWC